jgi:hypothetical protein
MPVQLIALMICNVRQSKNTKLPYVATGRGKIRHNIGQPIYLSWHIMKLISTVE